MGRGIVLVAVLSLTGCASKYSYGTKLLPWNYQKLVKGQTTRPQVVEQWGKPKEIVYLADGRILFYEWVEAEENGNLLKRTITRTWVAFDSHQVFRDYGIDELERVDVLNAPQERPVEDPGPRSRYER